MRRFITNAKLLKYPFKLKVYRYISQKGKKFPETIKWRYFRTREIFSNVYNNLNKRDMRRFKSFKKDVFFLI